MKLTIHTIVSMPFAENTYVVHLPGRQEALVIDPGLEPDLILDLLRRERLTPAALLCTHGHGDHIGGNRALKEAYPDAPLLIGEKEADFLTDPWKNLSALFGTPITSPPADRVVREGDTITYAGISLDVLDLPGHSPGHVVFVYRDQPSFVFAGDTLFQGSIGRTDFPNGNGPLLLRGIQTKLYTLPHDTVILSGHGDPTTTGEEKQYNPFVREE